MATDPVQLVRDRLKTSEDSLKQRHSMYNDLEDLFFGYVEGKYTWQSEVALPFTYQIVMQFASHLFNAFPKGRFIPNSPDETGATEAINELIKYQVEHPYQNFMDKLKRGGIEMSLLGTKFFTLHWRHEKDAKGRVKWNAPYVRPLYIYHCFPDPSATDIQDMQYFIHYDYATIDELEATNKMSKGKKNKRYKNLDKLKELIGDKDPKAADSSLQDNRVDTIRQLGNTGGKDNRIRLLKYYSRDRFITLASVEDGDDIVIEDKEHPYDHGELPIHMLKNTSYENQLLGLGEIEPIAPMMKAANNFFNQHLDNVRLRSYNIFQVEEDALDHMHTWQMEPGAKWVVNQMNQMQPMEVPDTTSSTFQAAYNLFRDETTKSSGAFDIITRQEGAIERTATEIMESSEESNARRKAKQVMIENFIKGLYNQMLQLNQQFLTQEEAIRVINPESIDKLKEEFPYAEEVRERGMLDSKTGEPIPQPTPDSIVTNREEPKFEVSQREDYGFLRVEPEDIAGSYDYIVESGSTVSPNNAREIQHKLKALEVLGDYPNANKRPIIEEILGNLGIKNVDNIFKEEDQQPGQQAQANNPQQAAQRIPQALGQAQGGQTPANQPGPSTGFAGGFSAIQG